VPIAFIKHVKQLAIFSFIADGFLLFSMVMFYRYDTLAQTHDVVTGIEWRTLPVFFGMAISSYEGIGLVRIYDLFSPKFRRHSLTCHDN
jgi:hypothetical protein